MVVGVGPEVDAGIAGGDWVANDAGAGAAVAGAAVAAGALAATVGGTAAVREA